MIGSVRKLRFRVPGGPASGKGHQTTVQPVRLKAPESYGDSWPTIIKSQR
jgi:hypothetical protein